MGFELRHPTGLTTNVFQPGFDHDIAKSTQDRLEAAVGKQTVDFTLYKYKFAASAWRYVRGLSILLPADAEDLEEFLEAADGDPFDFTDGSCGPVTSWVTVKLLPESYVRSYSYAAGGRLEVTLAMVTVP